MVHPERILRPQPALVETLQLVDPCGGHTVASMAQNKRVGFDVNRALANLHGAALEAGAQPAGAGKANTARLCFCSQAR
jgi:hypothetical protein